MPTDGIKSSDHGSREASGKWHGHKLSSEFIGIVLQGQGKTRIGFGAHYTDAWTILYVYCQMMMTNHSGSYSNLWNPGVAFNAGSLKSTTEFNTGASICGLLHMQSQQWLVGKHTRSGCNVSCLLNLHR